MNLKKTITKKSPVVYHEVRTRTYIRNMRHYSLHLGDVNN